MPVIPRAKVKNQNRPSTLPCAPCAAVPRVAPRTIKSVVDTKATFLPRRSQTSPTTTWPMTAPVCKCQISTVSLDNFGVAHQLEEHWTPELTQKKYIPLGTTS